MDLPLVTACRVPRPVEIVRAPGKHPLLVEIEPWHPEPATYDPLERRGPKLWEAVAALAECGTTAEGRDTEAAAAFASAWGFLTGQVEGWFPPRPEESIEPIPMRAAQHPERWWSHEALPAFGVAVALFRGLTTGRWDGLDPDRFGIEPGKGRNEGSYIVHAATPNQGMVYRAKTTHPSHRTVAARSLISELAAGGLRSTRLQWSPGRGVHGIADTPLACAWLQLLHDVDVSEGGECEVCKKWILWDRKNRRGKRFCSVRCRVAAHRREHRRE